MQPPVDFFLPVNHRQQITDLIENREQATGKRKEKRGKRIEERRNTPTQHEISLPKNQESTTKNNRSDLYRALINARIRISNSLQKLTAYGDNSIFPGN